MMAADDRSVLPRTFVTGAMLDLMSFLSKDGDKFPQNSTEFHQEFYRWRQF
jgi:hypothetical protein